MSKRIRASLIHLLISILLVSSVLAVVLLVWYPRPYFEAMGIDKILMILAAVDVSIGPLITLIIFNPAKKSLKFDLAVIAVLQFSALMYGAHVMYTSRPAYVVAFNIFTVVAASDIPAEELRKAAQSSLPVTGPQLVGARLPAASEERKRVVFSAVQGGLDLPQMPQYYLPYTAVASDVKARMLSDEALLKRFPKAQVKDTQAIIDDALSKKGLRITDVGFVPMRAKVRDMTVLVRRSDASIVAILPINPWGGAVR